MDYSQIIYWIMWVVGGVILLLVSYWAYQTITIMKRFVKALSEREELERELDEIVELANSRRQLYYILTDYTVDRMHEYLNESEFTYIGNDFSKDSAEEIKSYLNKIYSSVEKVGSIERLELKLKQKDQNNPELKLKA